MASIKETAEKFFDACETGKGWQACKSYCHPDATFSCQAEALAEYGFDIEHFGERTYLVRSVPSVLQGKNVAQSLTELLDFLGEGARSDWGEEIAVSLACHSAVLAGQALSQEEMVDLVRQLENTSQPKTCPHGRPTMIHLSAAQLERGFGRR